MSVGLKVLLTGLVLLSVTFVGAQPLDRKNNRHMFVVGCGLLVSVATSAVGALMWVWGV